MYYVIGKIDHLKRDYTDHLRDCELNSMIGEEIIGIWLHRAPDGLVVLHGREYFVTYRQRLHPFDQENADIVTEHVDLYPVEIDFKAVQAEHLATVKGAAQFFLDQHAVRDIEVTRAMLDDKIARRDFA